MSTENMFLVWFGSKNQNRHMQASDLFYKLDSVKIAKGPHKELSTLVPYILLISLISQATVCF